MKDEAITWAMLALSVAAHVPLVCGEGTTRATARPEPATLELTALPPPPEVEAARLPEAVPLPEVPAQKPPPNKPAEVQDPIAHEPVAEAPATEPPPATEAVPAELTGTTLTSDVSASWSAPTGNGAGRSGVLSAGTRPKGKALPAAVPPTPATEPPGVPLAELSRKPQPPPLERSLERHYPSAARKLGQSGEAKVRARIEANGNVRIAKITSDSGHGFGASCRAALLESRWTAPLDSEGKGRGHVDYVPVYVPRAGVIR